MQYLLSNLKIKVSPEHIEIIKQIPDNKRVFIEFISLSTGIPISSISESRLILRSIDARAKPDIFFIYKVVIECNISDKVFLNLKKTCEHKDIKIRRYTSLANNDYILESKFYQFYLKDNESNFSIAKRNLIIVGLGPSGLFSALLLSQYFNINIFEKGRDVDNRLLDIQKFLDEGKFRRMSNILCGEGGGGMFSDGKLTTRKRGELENLFLRYLVCFGAPKNILYDKKPHIGTDILRGIIKNIRKYLVSMGVRFHFESEMTDIIKSSTNIKSIIVNNMEYFADIFILAIGYGTQTLRILINRDIPAMTKGYAIGLRVEHPQAWIDKTQYGSSTSMMRDLGFAGEYFINFNPTRHLFKDKTGIIRNDFKKIAMKYGLKLPSTKDISGVYSFCMCPGGYIIPASSEIGRLVTNGMSFHSRSNIYGNSALVMPVSVGLKPIIELDKRENLEKFFFNAGFETTGKKYFAPIQSIEDFLRDSLNKKNIKISYKPGFTLYKLKGLLLDKVYRSLFYSILYFEKIMPGFIDMGVLTGPETRTSSPIRFVRDKNILNIIGYKNLYIVGEGSGYAGGIVSSAVDGIKIALKIIHNS